MASPTYRSKANGGGSTAANVTVNVPASTADNDILIFWMSKDDTGAVTWPGGWNIIQESTDNIHYAGLAWRRASGEPANYTWNFASTWRDAIMLSYQGAVTSENPLDPDTPPAFVTGTHSGNTSYTPSNVTTTLADSVAIAFFADPTIVTWGAAPGSWVQRQGGGGNEVCVDDQAFASAGAITGPTQPATTSIGANKAAMIALQSLSSDQHYQEPAKFPGVFNLDARRMI